MRRWWRTSLTAAMLVADRPALWLAGALPWTVTVGWFAFLAGVAPPPSIGELTFRGAGIFASGAWPWNAIGIGAAALAVALVAVALASAGEAVLLHGRRVGAGEVARLFGIALVCAVPVLVGLVTLAAAVIVVAPGEFNAPGAGIDPLARTALAIAPLLAGTVLAAAAGAAIHAAAARHRGDVVVALLEAPRALAGAGLAAVLQAGALLLARVAYLVVGAMLLRVLWMPIGIQLAGGEIGVATLLLLVGFVAIWLCLVLGGGALHAWGSLSWTGVLRSGQERLEARTGA
ncbi:MAG TPA: hypothetical protein VMP86_03600 [Candidatus Binatia bacterium]|nr:hypothetical protein [Candidatus Binatia bacterium]